VKEEEEEEEEEGDAEEEGYAEDEEEGEEEEEEAANFYDEGGFGWNMGNDYESEERRKTKKTDNRNGSEEKSVGGEDAGRSEVPGFKLGKDSSVPDALLAVLTASSDRAKLGISNGVALTKSVLKRAYFATAREVHPDKNLDYEAEAAVAFQRIGAAHEALKYCVCD